MKISNTKNAFSTQNNSRKNNGTGARLSTFESLAFRAGLLKASTQYALIPPPPPRRKRFLLKAVAALAPGTPSPYSRSAAPSAADAAIEIDGCRMP